VRAPLALLRPTATALYSRSARPASTASSTAPPWLHSSRACSVRVRRAAEACRGEAWLGCCPSASASASAAWLPSRAGGALKTAMPSALSIWLSRQPAAGEEEAWGSSLTAT
jgi:hypothetical protein